MGKIDVKPIPSKSQSRLKVFTFGKAVYFRLGDANEVKPDRICFSCGVPVAVSSGGFFYIADQWWSKTTTKHINDFTNEDTTPVVTIRLPPDEFDFVVGSILSKAALPLTSRTRGPNNTDDH